MIPELDESELAHVDSSVSPFCPTFSLALTLSPADGSFETFVAAEKPEDAFEVW